MAWFGQKSYNEKMGNGTFTIAQIGCFVTAFSNLLEKLGEPNVTPEALNTFFTSHNIYMADPADGQGVKDDLTWGSITAYNSEITVAGTGSGSWPNSDNAIVEFRYNESGQEIVHFCVVESVVNKTIIDSWDGIVKEPGIYGAPVAWATYEKNTPKSVPVPHPASTVPIMPIANPIPSNYKLITIEPGWGLERIAAAAGRSDAAKVSCWQLITEANGGKDWQTFNEHLQPNQKVKVPLQGNHGEGEPTAEDIATLPAIPSFDFNSITLDITKKGMYISLTDVPVTNLADPIQTKPLPADQPVSIVGEFMYKNIAYMLPTFAYSEKSWFAIPSYCLKSDVPIVKTKKSFYDHIIAIIGGAVGLLKRKKSEV